MKARFVTTLLGLGLGLAALESQDAVAQKRIDLLPSGTAERLRTEALDMTLPVFQNKQAEDSLKQDLGERYADYRRGALPKIKAVFPHGPGYAGMYTRTHGATVYVKQITTANLKRSVEVAYEPAYGDDEVIGGFTITHSDTSKALSSLQSQSFTLDSTAAGLVYRKTSEQLVLGQPKTGRVTAMRTYHPDGSRDNTVSYKSYKNNVLTDSMITSHGLVVTTYQNGSATQTRPDTVSAHIVALKASIQKMVGEQNTRQIEPFYPEIQASYTGPKRKTFTP